MSGTNTIMCFLFYFLILMLREEGSERETAIWERNIDRLPSLHAPTRDWTHNPTMCPHQESNRQPCTGRFPTTWATAAGCTVCFLNSYSYLDFSAALPSAGELGNTKWPVQGHRATTWKNQSSKMVYATPVVLTQESTVTRNFACVSSWWEVNSFHQIIQRWPQSS